MKNNFVFTSIPTVGTQALKGQRGERGAFLEVVGGGGGGYSFQNNGSNSLFCILGGLNFAQYFMRWCN